MPMQRTTPQSKLAPFEFQRRELRAHDVQMEVLFCGVCHSDLHQARNEWKNTVYPVVPGHEIVGRVTAVRSGRDEATRRAIWSAWAVWSTRAAPARVARKDSNSIAKTVSSAPTTV